ncbi:MAG: 4Fe-4S dicluster domain-containing protein [Desulfobacteraceae bacterium]|nr:4Fe-4S dicluster domain-containing protein [Desulfobacteraceae bacterium]
MQPSLSPDFSFLQKAEAAGPFNAAECFQCRKCTNGCPASFEMDLFPDQVIRLAILGQKEEVLRSRTIWICASCETCSTRCPNGVRIAELMDYFKEMSIRTGVSPAQPHVASLHQTFLGNVRLTGRVFEGGLLPAWWLKSGQLGSKIRSGGIRNEMKMALKLFRKGRLATTPKTIKGKAEVGAILRSS